jgi:hypothetical protein
MARDELLFEVDEVVMSLKNEIKRVRTSMGLKEWDSHPDEDRKGSALTEDHLHAGLRKKLKAVRS